MIMIALHFMTLPENIDKVINVFQGRLRFSFIVIQLIYYQRYRAKCIEAINA